MAGRRCLESAVVLTSLLAAAASGRAEVASYQYIDLGTGLPDSAGALVTGGAGGLQVGYSTVNYRAVATVWQGSMSSTVSVSPWSHQSEIWGTDGTQLVGVGYAYGDADYGAAFLWNGVTSSVVNLQGLNFAHSRAYGVHNGRQVGVAAGSRTGGANHAIIWSGAADSYVDLHPGSAYSDSEARGIWGNQIAGSASYILSQEGGIRYVTSHAHLWLADTGTAVDLHPAGYTSSRALGVGSGQQVGFGHLPDGSARALLWTGSADSVVDLGGAAAASVAFAAAGGRQAGYAAMPGVNQHAVVWSGSAASMVDLHLLAGPGATRSQALGIDSTGNVYGFVEYGLQARAAMWVPVPEPMTAALLAGGLALLGRRRGSDGR